MEHFIDRNPEIMMKYSNEAQTSIGNMVLLIRKVEGMLDACSKDLDTPTQKQIEELHKCCSDYFKQVETYQTIAGDIYRKARRLNDIRNGGC